jgi:hypothetical protein
MSRSTGFGRQDENWPIGRATEGNENCATELVGNRPYLV